MKFLLASLALFGVVSSAPDFATVKQCIYDKCPNEAAACNTACEAKLEKCGDKCGLVVNQTCWAPCVGLIGPAPNAALCAVKQGCLGSNSTAPAHEKLTFEQIGRIIDGLLEKNY